MTAGWPLVSLRDAGVSLLDCEHRTPPAAPDGFPYIAIPQMKDGRLDLREVRRISAEHLDEWTRKAKPATYDVVLSRRCNPGETSVVPSGLECALGQNLVLLRADGKRVFPPFLRWWVRGPAWWEQVGRFLNVGAVFDSLKCADVPNFSLPLPSLAEQRAIAGMLCAVDDKIELNRRMNETLEELARTVFTSWFVDFDPVRAKAGGRQPVGMDAATAALFPTRFVESELGEIPEGWRAGALADVIELHDSKRIPLSKRERELRPGRYPYYGASNIVDYIDDFLFDGTYLLVSEDGENLRTRKTPIAFLARGQFWVNNHAHILAGKRPVVVEHLTLFFQRCDINPYLTGAVQPKLSQENLKRIPFLCADDAVTSRFAGVIEPWFAQMAANDDQSKTLAELRNLLLPKLTSGELRILVAEKMVEAAL